MWEASKDKPRFDCFIAKTPSRVSFMKRFKHCKAIEATHHRTRDHGPCQSGVSSATKMEEAETNGMEWVLTALARWDSD